MSNTKIVGVGQKIIIRRDKTNKQLWVFEVYYIDIIDGVNTLRAYPNFISARYRTRRSCTEAIMEYNRHGFSGVSWNDEKAGKRIRELEREQQASRGVATTLTGGNFQNEKAQTEKSVKKKSVVVTCWHCGNPKQKILSYDSVFKCDVCKESLWTGEGGYEE